MKLAFILMIVIGGFMLSLSCTQVQSDKHGVHSVKQQDLTAKDILGNPEYLAISYGGYREKTRDIQPTMEQLKEDMRILYAMGIRLIRTYNVEKPHAANVVKAIHELKQENPAFEMYVMLGAWINCAHAFTDHPNHDMEDEVANASEIERAIKIAKEFPEIVKIIAVGNEAMVKWAASYYVQPWVILKWVNHLQDLKAKGQLPAELWITSSDNFASWGGGGAEYHVEDLAKLFKAVDFVSIHTYPMHDTHYNPDFWKMNGEEAGLAKFEKIDSVMQRSKRYAMSQYQSVVDYMRGLGVDKPVHIGESGWATASNSHYGPDGSGATDEYKSAIFYRLLREWTNREGITCFYFEAFDEPWKDAGNPGGSENHFGLFDVEGKAKYALWDLVDDGVFEGLSRDGNPIVKTYGGKKEALLEDVLTPVTK